CDLSTVISSVLCNPAYHSRDAPRALWRICRKLVVCHSKNHFTQALEALVERFARFTPVRFSEVMHFRPVFAFIWLDLPAVDSPESDVRPRCNVNHKLP